ncbi:helix-turn-helix domain-containing protein [Dyadobacter chenwenxiniae]|uniref:Helix-turn-helix domain-containing protein n=1 Tax=Dyadobacter chenwenxiniae TaxID=2906456 RepID=A0A9X1PU15_9BACT|nr:helix-turn-helix domain-containing protein [Dyadobacter chenwenxiniae]MCF0065091.1 helix-turn-helix domain-containing protein [Dyadobacter chenwenxiniae]UON84637.1 helix-turn-helix domain-containing protein [Dyadobacter chenwenxiniae]
MERMRGTDEAKAGLSLDQLVTLADLKNVRDELLAAIARTRGSSPDTVKKWLKSSEVRKLLNISPGKLLALKANRQLAFVRLGGVIYYDRDDIEAMIQKAKVPTLIGKA